MFDLTGFEVGDEFEGAAADLNRVISAILAAGGSFKYVGKSITILTLPKPKKTEEPITETVIESPVEEDPVEETPVEEALVEAVTVEEAPAEEAPVEVEEEVAIAPQPKPRRYRKKTEDSEPTE